jgi:hypothetical protein
MTLFALSPEASDALTVWGFVVGVIGCLIGVLGFGYTIYQVKKVKAAAEAAEEAATKAVADSQASYQRFVGTFGYLLASELQSATNAKDWKFASLRARDLASLLGTVVISRPPVRELIGELRSFAQKFAKRAAGENPKFSEPKWTQLLNDLHAQLDELNAPFRESSHGAVSLNDPGREVPGDGEEPPREDESGPSPLGPRSPHAAPDD